MRQARVLLVVQISLAGWLGAPVWGAPQGAAVAEAQTRAAGGVVATVPGYILGPGDVIAIKALDIEDVSNASIRIDPSGQISLPVLGRVTVGGVTVEGLEKELSSRLKIYVREPTVAVSIVEYRSQPVFVIGAVGAPGVHQLEGRKNLIEILAKAGGLTPEAGSVVKITRQAEWGLIPLPSAAKDATGQFSVAEVSINGILRATSPEENILVLPNDVISVPRADLIYVIGEVKKPGGFTLNERRTVSAVQALAMAEGFTATAAPQRAVIIRPSSDGKGSEIPVNLRDMLNGKTGAVELLPNDILLVPDSAARTALGRLVQTAIQAATASVIYAGF